MARIKIEELKAYVMRRNSIFIAVLLLPLIIGVVVFFSEDRDEFTKMGNASYPRSSGQARCNPGDRPGSAGATYGESTKEGIKFNVRTPLNYDPAFPHPLIVVYAPAGANRSKTEKNTGLTYLATTAGFIVAYADHPQLSTSSTVELGTIPGLIKEAWCIDEQRVFLTGHSDGGSVAMALAFMAGTKQIPSAIAPSAAGINNAALRSHRCPEPLPVMIMHSAKDRFFPGFGIESSGWWAACNNCDPIPDKRANGCIVYSGCDNGVETWYCEGDKTHSQWPGLNVEILEFFSSVSGLGKGQAKSVH